MTETNPSPSAPIRSSRVTRTPSKWIDARPIALLPRSSKALREMPGSARSTQKADTPRAPAPPVRASTTARFAAMPSVIEVFSPWSSQPSPSGVALSSRLAASVPWPGSVIMMQGTVSPEAMPGNQAAFCSSVALRTMMSLISAVLMITYPALKSARPTSEAAMPALTAVASWPPYG